MQCKLPEFLHDPIHFILESISAVIIFLTIAGVAGFLGYIVEALSENGFDPILVDGLKVVEYSLFGLDAVLFVALFAKKAYRFWRDS